MIAKLFEDAEDESDEVARVEIPVHGEDFPICYLREYRQFGPVLLVGARALAVPSTD